MDIFAGGCAVTHAAMLSGKFAKIIANDKTDAPQIFINAIDGKYQNYNKVLSRDDFRMTESTLDKLLYSFGNDKSSYLWGEDIEHVKVAASKMLMAPTLNERYIFYHKFIKAIGVYLRDARSVNEKLLIESISRIERLQSISSTISVNELSCLKKRKEVSELVIMQDDYRNVFIPTGAIIYADPPYRRCRNSKRYCGDFDYSEFNKWLEMLQVPCIVSEYDAPKGCVEIAKVDKVCSIHTGTLYKTERLFIQDKFYDWYKGVI